MTLFCIKKLLQTFNADLVEFQGSLEWSFRGLVLQYWSRISLDADFLRTLTLNVGG